MTYNSIKSIVWVNIYVASVLNFFPFPLVGESWGHFQGAAGNARPSHPIGQMLFEQAVIQELFAGFGSVEQIGEVAVVFIGLGT